MEQWMWIIWLVIFAVTMIVEVCVPDLVSIWFALSALATLCFSFIEGLPYWGEIIIFVGLSLILLASTRKFVKKFLKSKETVKTNLSTLIGKEYILDKTIEPFSKGEVIINGVAWDCETKDNSTIEKGKIIKIKEIQGNKLIVEEIKHEY